ncbi:pyridoxamine 5'-phosphate oxidase family protein [Thermopolyspora sp. NPDC052614]|uniref:helix-turn-helix domain-containing protein n=1 Tax=Thermopolyspora sp. NPDC052614 TaxID=3155682 RepID=UPI00343DECE7
MSQHTGGDTGRRIAHRRHDLGLTREELGERAGMAPGYIQYVEESTTSITTGDLLRLASALETTVDELLGGRTQEPPGASAPVGRRTLTDIDRDECLRLIAPGGIGRIAWYGLSGPVVLPVNYRLHDGAIVFRTQEGGLMDQDLRTGIEGVEIKVGFEVDRIDETNHEGWSVLVQGPAHLVTDPEEIAKVTEADVQPWAGGPRDLYLRITPYQVTGRRIQGI